jgi:YhcH/YjgK/YiaL family protein
MALAWLQTHINDDFNVGRIDVSPSIYVNVETPALRPREKALLEAHRKYIDIHVPLKGTEIIGWAPIEDLKYVSAPYDADRDVIFYNDSAHSLLHVQHGQIAIFFPEDAHAPNIGIGNHRKLCIKISVDS